MDRLPSLNKGDTTRVDTACLNVYASVQGSVYLDDSEDHARRHLHHADTRLSAESPSAEDRLDAMMALKRAVDSRVKFIVKAHAFRNAPGFNPSMSKFEILQKLGLMRPLMSKELYDLRATMEHSDAAPPDKNECLRFAEFVFYFINATNALVREATESMLFSASEGGEDDVEVSRKPPAWEFNVRGRFGLSDFNGYEPNSEMMDIVLKNDPILHGDRLYLNGLLVGPQSVIEMLVDAFVTYR